MKNFKKALKDIYYTLNNIVIFEDMLTAMIIFLSCYLVLMLLNANTFLAAIPALSYIVYFILRDTNARLNNERLIVVENVCPELNEKLRTAADNIYLENPVVDELQNNVIHDLKKVRASSFFNTKKTSYKLFASIILCFLIVLVAVLNFKLIDFGIFLSGKPNILFGEPTNETTDSDILSAGGGSTDDIFGEESIAELGNEQLFIEINSLSFELTNVRKETELPQEEFQEKFPDEVDMIQDCGADCVLRNDIPLKQQELVKNYFIKLAET